MSLAYLAQFFDIHEISPDDWPVVCNVTMPNAGALDMWPNWPSAALPAAGRAASGRGEDWSGAIISGLGEAVEIASLCRWGDETTFFCDGHELFGTTWDPVNLNGFSDAQIEERTSWNMQMSGFD